MFQLVYKSKPAPGYDPDDCTEILFQSRRNNPKMGITGALLYTGTYFVQALEGSEEAVREVYATVKRDPRHEQIECLSEHEVEEAEFGRWTMAFPRTKINENSDLEHQLQFMTESACEETRALFTKFLNKTRKKQH